MDAIARPACRPHGTYAACKGIQGASRLSGVVAGYSEAMGGENIRHEHSGSTEREGPQQRGAMRMDEGTAEGEGQRPQHPKSRTMIAVPWPCPMACLCLPCWPHAVPSSPSPYADLLPSCARSCCKSVQQGSQRKARWAGARCSATMLLACRMICRL